jgi:hypothetical protein
VPVHERAIGVLLPRPDMQSVERREPETIGALEQVKKLSHELWRIRMRFIPRIGEQHIIGADQVLRSHGLTYQEIAVSVQVKPNYVGSLVSRAQDAFRKEYLKRYGKQS